MPGSNCETWRWICYNLDSNILVFCWSYNNSGQITASDYVDIFGNQGHPLSQMLFSNNSAVFRDDSSFIRTAERVQSWFEECEGALQHVTWPAQ